MFVVFVFVCSVFVGFVFLHLLGLWFLYLLGLLVFSNVRQIYKNVFTRVYTMIHIGSLCVQGSFSVAFLYLRVCLCVHNCNVSPRCSVPHSDVPHWAFHGCIGKYTKLFDARKDFGVSFLHFAQPFFGWFGVSFSKGAVWHSESGGLAMQNCHFRGASVVVWRGQTATFRKNNVVFQRKS